jgi:Holliday junction resolvase-like predicted endonuclease
MLLLMSVLLGFDVDGEVGTNLGSIDAVCKQANQTTVIEIKYSKNKPLDALIKKALNQIKEKKYYEAYMQKPVNLLAIAFAAGQKENRLTEIKCVFENLK